MALLQRRATRGALTVLAVAGIGFTAPLLQASADPSPTASCLEAGNVWVLVENDDALGGGCATEFGTGFEALASAGFDVEADDTGFITTIDGVPGVKGPQDWWAYAHTDADVTAWQFYEVGAALAEPSAGSIEAWKLMHSYEDTDTYPSVTPAELLEDVAATPSPSPSATTTATNSPEPSVAPSASATPTGPATSPSPVRPSLPHTGN